VPLTPETSPGTEHLGIAPANRVAETPDQFAVEVVIPGSGLLHHPGHDLPEFKGVVVIGRLVLEDIGKLFQQGLFL
jgi:hypothetical protein